MQFIKTKFTSSLLILSLVLFVSSGLFPKVIDAAQMTSAKDTMSTQAPSATATHTITWTLATGATNAVNDTIAIAFNAADFTAGGTWQTSDFAFTGNAAGSLVAPGAVNGACAGSGTTNYKVDVSSSTFTITLCTGWTASAATFANTFVIYGTAGTGTGTLTNKASDVDSSLITITDTGNDTDSTTLAVVVETNDVVTVTATVNPTLTLNISSNSVGLGTITTAATATGTHTARVGTNAAGGFLLTYNGATLTASGGTIAAYGSQASSVAGTAGFGINLKDNATPNVGTELVNNAGTCAAPVADYGTVDKYSYVASTTTSLTNQTTPADCTYTVSYVANISAVTPAGSYTTPITYIASGTF